MPSLRNFLAAAWLAASANAGVISTSDSMIGAGVNDAMIGDGASVLFRRAAVATPFPITTAQQNSFTPMIHFASAAYCFPNTTVPWTCGPDCQGSAPSFVGVASGGDGGAIQYWYVGWDPRQLNPAGLGGGKGTIIVGHQGTDTRQALAVATDINIALTNLDSKLFPGTPFGVLVHSGFRDQQAKTAAPILAAVKQAMSRFGSNSVVVTGHSLGAALALLDGLYLTVQLPNTVVGTVDFASPRVGNSYFANYIDARMKLVQHVGNKQDPVPVSPPMSVGYHNPSGEFHIVNNGTWFNCPGQDNPSTLCSTGAVPTVFQANTDDHDGPYNGVNMGFQCVPDPYA